MAFDGIITRAVIAELKPNLIGAKVNKIYEPTKNDIVLELYNNGQNYSLNLCINPESCRISLTTYSKPNPQVAPNFCMLLRKYLVGGRIIDISNMDLERTVEIKFETYNELNDLVQRKLFIEIMSRQSNIILTNENNIIIDTLKHVDNSSRELLPAHPFEFTKITKQSFMKLSSFEEFYEIINNTEKTELSKILPSIFIGISKTFILQVLLDNNIEDSDFSKEALKKIYTYIFEILNNIGTYNVSCVELENDYSLSLKENNQTFNINYFIDKYYHIKENKNNFKSSRNNLLKIILATLKKEHRKLANINKKLNECSNMDTYKLYGELLTANLYRFKDTPNVDKVELENYYDGNKIVTIPLDKTISVHKNIDKYFKKYNKLKNALDIVTIQKKETEKELDYFESIVFSLENAQNLSDINEVYEEISENIVTKKEVIKKTKQGKKKQAPKNEFKLSSVDIDGYTVYIGKNNIQNDYLSLKFADKNDYWFHTQKIHGSHVILKTNGNTEVPDSVLTKCAILAKENSKASNSSNVPIDFCLARYVKKSPGSKPGMVIYTNYKTIHIR